MSLLYSKESLLGCWPLFTLIVFVGMACVYLEKYFLRPNSKLPKKNTQWKDRLRIFKPSHQPIVHSDCLEEDCEMYHSKEDPIKEDDTPKEDHILYVCTKCSKKDSLPCSSIQNCKLAQKDPGADIEDLFQDNPKDVKTGRILYESLKKIQQHDEDFHELIQPTGLKKKPRVRRRIRIQPVDCLSVCDRANAVAFSSPRKFTYQFADLDHNDPSTLEDILEFADQYVESSDGFSKSKERPKRLRANLTARVPPFGVPFVNQSN